MKSKILWLAILSSFAVSVQAQGVLGKLKQKAEQAASKALDKKVEQKTGVPSGDTGGSSGSGTSGSSSSSGGNHPTNNGGGGLITTPPDVKQNLTDAETAFKASSYGEARYAVQQAMLGVELEIGNKVLKSLPETVSGLPKQAEQDQVTSTGWGWAGLTIQRQYLKGDKELKATIANNAAWMSAVNMYLANGGYAQQTNGQQNWKQIKVKGYRGVIEYDDSSGYKISVPIGQSSLIVWEGINFSSEQDMMNAANTFDIDGIKNMLGEK
jgi:hypothetical protein